jgi:hypothetical protein
LIDQTTIEAMKAAGIPAEQILSVVEDALRRDAEVKAARREVDRIRKRNERAAEKATRTTVASEMSVGQSRTDADASDTPPSPKESPQTPKEIPPSTLKEKTPKGVQKKGSRLPDDFDPDIDFALSTGLTRSQAETEAAKFRDYWASKATNATKTDWQATWRNWVRTAAERLQPRNRAGPAPRAAPIDHFRNLASELNGQDRDDRGPSGHRDDAPGLPLRAIEHHG